MFAYEGVGAITLPRHRGYALGFMVTAFTFTGHVKLTRFRGHPNICVQGVHDGEDETTLHT